VALFAQQRAPQTGSFVELISQGFSSTGPYGFYIGHDAGNPAFIRATDASSSPNTGVLFPADGRRHHYALVIDAEANESRLYLDCSLVWSLGFAIALQAGGNDTLLGRQYAPYAEYFGGTLDDVRVFDHALSIAELSSLSCPHYFRFRRGDCNDDSTIDISDPVCALNWLFLGTSEPACVAAINMNGDAEVDISDPVYLLAFLFLGGPPPLPPFQECGMSVEADEALGCASPPAPCG
jgi:hypothetical protein